MAGIWEAVERRSVPTAESQMVANSRCGRRAERGISAAGGIEPFDRTVFAAATDVVRVDNLTLAHLSGRRGRAGRPAPDGRAIAPIILLQQKAGQTEICHEGARSVMEAGDICIFDCSLPLKWNLGNDADCLAVCFDAREFQRSAPKLAPGIVLSRKMPETRLLGKLVEALWDEAMTGEIVGASQILFEAIGLAARPSAGESSPQAGNALFRQALEIIDRNLLEPTLCVSGIAAQLGITTRYLQRLFARHGTTPRAHVAQSRISYAARLLSDGSASVTGAAMEAGFNDLTHFGRLFRKTFGETPREYRRRTCALAG